MDGVQLGNIIQMRREKLAIRQEDLAEMAGITPKTIYLVETGKGNPSLGTLIKLLDILGLEISVDIKKISE